MGPGRRIGVHRSTGDDEGQKTRVEWDSGINLSLPTTGNLYLDVGVMDRVDLDLPVGGSTSGTRSEDGVTSVTKDWRRRRTWVGPGLVKDQYTCRLSMLGGV